MFTALAQANPWEAVPPLPEPNAGFVAGVIGEEIVIAGGTNWPDGTKHWLDKIWVLDTRTLTWRESGHLETPLAYPASASTGEGIIMAGGSTGTETRQVLSLLTATGERRVAPIEPSVVLSVGAIVGEELYVIGGTPDQAQLEKINSACYAINLISGKSRPLPTLPVPGFIVGGGTVCDGKLYIFGGAYWEGEIRNLATAFVLGPAGWEPLPPLPFANRGLKAITLDDEHILIAGGYKNDEEEFASETFIYHTARRDYTPGPPLPIRALVTLVRSGPHIYSLGGEDKKQHRTDACYRIQISTLLGTK